MECSNELEVLENKVNIEKMYGSVTKNLSTVQMLHMEASLFSMLQSTNVIVNHELWHPFANKIDFLKFKYNAKTIFIYFCIFFSFSRVYKGFQN